MAPITDPARLAVLEKARAKAKENRELRKKQKEQDEKEAKEKQKVEPPSIKIEPKMEEKQESKDTPLCQPEEKPKSTFRPPTPPPSEPQVVVVKKPKKSKQKVVYIESSSEDEAPIVIKRRGRRKPKVVYEEEEDLDTSVRGGQRKFVNPRNMSSKPPQTDITASLATPSDKQPIPPPPVLQRDKPYTFQVSSIMNKYFPN